MEVILRLLDSDDPQLEKRGLQKICETIENGGKFTDPTRFKLFKFLSKFQNSTDILVRRWLYKTIALLNDRSFLPYLKGQLNGKENDPENITWIVSSIYKLLNIDEAKKIIKVAGFSDPTTLASGYFQPSLLPQNIRKISKILDSNDALALKWLSLLYGNSLDHFEVNKQKLLDRITRLNLHNNEEVAEYSIWALYKSKEGTFADSEISPQNIPNFSPNIRRWIYRLITKQLKDIMVNYDFIKYSISNETNISAREGLATGLGKYANIELLVDLIIEWFNREKNLLVRSQLLICISDNSSCSDKYQQILNLEIENPYDQVSKIIAQKGISKLLPEKTIQTTIHFEPMKKLESSEFKVAFSFPGEKRSYVLNVVRELEKLIPKEDIFYDEFYKSQLAKPNIDIILQNIYHNQTKLNAIFLCTEYVKKEWTGVEWRAIKDLIKQKKDDQIMLLKFDDSQIDGIFSTDGYIDLRKENPKNIAKYIKERLDVL